MPDRIFVTLEGAEEIKKRLLAMGEAASGMTLIPIVGEATAELAAIMAALAPRRSGALARGINPSYLKSGPGYCYFEVKLSPKAYYGLFQEFGLGDKAGRPASARTKRRQANYDVTKELYRRGYRQGAAGIDKRQGRRLRYMAQGKYIQGKRRPNMAAQPFIRPAIFGNRVVIIREMVEQIGARVMAETE